MARSLPALLACLLTWALASPAIAAEFTDLLDAADDFDDLDNETFDAFDFHIEPAFTFKYSSAQITREAPCVPQLDPNASDLVKNNPRLEVNPGRCSESRIIYNKELAYTGTRAQLDLKLRAGIYKDLEFRFNLPYVFANTRRIGYDTDVSKVNSSVDPSTSCAGNPNGRCIEREANKVFDPADTQAQQIDKLERFGAYRYFNVENERQYTRSGFAEPTVGLHWSMFNDERDPTKANLLLGFDYQLPIVPVAQRDNNAIGTGLQAFQFKIASSKKFGWIEPYVGLEYFLPIAMETSPIRKVDSNNRGQVFDSPPMRGEFTLGTEFIPYENKEKGQRYGIDLRFTFGYVSEGRDFSPLYDHLAQSQCNNKSLANVLPSYGPDGTLSNPEDVGCAWIVRQPSNASPKPIYDLGAAVDDGSITSTRFTHDGILTVEDYATFRGRAGFYLQPASNFQINAIFEIEHHQEHFLSNARTGRDVDNEQTADETVDLEGPDAAIERNPVYNAAYDSAGERFRIQAFNHFTFMVNAALQF